MLAYFGPRNAASLARAAAAAAGNVNVARQRRILRREHLGRHGAQVRIVGHRLLAAGRSSCNTAPLPWSSSFVLMLRTSDRWCICLAV